MEDEIDEVVGHPAHHGEVGQEDDGDLNYEVEVDDEENSQGERDVQNLSVVNVGRDNLGLSSLNQSGALEVRKRSMLSFPCMESTLIQ